MDERRTVADDDEDPARGRGRGHRFGRAERIAAERWGTASRIGREGDRPPTGDGAAGRVRVPAHVMDRLAAASSAALGEPVSRHSLTARRGRSPFTRLFGSFGFRGGRGRRRRAQRRLTIVSDLPGPLSERTVVPEHAR